MLRAETGRPYTRKGADHVPQIYYPTPPPFTLPAVVLALLALALIAFSQASAQTESRYFPETGHYVKGLFLKYWNEHGGLAQQGYPLTEEFDELSTLDNKTYTVQYFERAVFERHPENAGTPYEVLLTQLGTYELQGRYPGGAPASTPSIDSPRVFTETGHTVGGKFRAYWEQQGGLAQQGYPLTDEFSEQNKLNGQTYMVQYFERAIFELHPENAGSPYEVLLTQLGKYQLDSRYPNNSNPAAAKQPAPTAVPATATPVPPTATPCIGCPATPTPSSSRYVKINGVRTDTYLKQAGTGSYSTKQGFVFVIVDARVGGPAADVPCTADASIIAESGDTYVSVGGGLPGSYFLGGSTCFDVGYGDFVFVVEEQKALGHAFTFHLKDYPLVPFTVPK